jgi:hypothetical protein
VRACPYLWNANFTFRIATASRKEECVTFPIFLLLLALEVLDISVAGRRAALSALDYLSTQGMVILRYVRLVVIPFGFTCDSDILIV